MFELTYEGCISIHGILSGKDITKKGNRICKCPMEEGSMKEHSEQGRLSRPTWHKHSDSRVNEIKIRDSGEEGGRDQTVKGYMCM